MMHWKQLSTAEKIEAVKTAWQPGTSASQIAANLNGATRNAVIGLYGRWPDDLAGTPLLRPTKSVFAMVKAKAMRSPRPSTRRPGDRPDMPPLAWEPPPSVTEEQHLCGRPLMMLEAKQCRWGVNEPDRFELHLFCALPAEKSFCEAHLARGYKEPKSRDLTSSGRYFREAKRGLA